MDNTPLVSVIVPIYNVEKYVRKCLDSLKNQTLREIEIICIDDGSTDGSGRIADEYKSDEFPIFQVFHTENRGLSAVRNRGIDEARAEWIMFVDSDDWVDPRFCEIPYKAAVENQADLVIFQAYRVRKYIKKPRNTKVPVGLMNHETAIELGDVIVWNKLFKRVLFDGIRFPEGHVFEEVATTHKLIYKADRIIGLSDKLYYYWYRKGSICNSDIGDEDQFMMSKQRYAELVEFEYPKQKANRELFSAALRYCGRTQRTDSDLYFEAIEILENIKRIPVEFSIKDRFKLHMWRLNTGIYRLTYKMSKGVV